MYVLLWEHSWPNQNVEKRIHRKDSRIWMLSIRDPIQWIIMNILRFFSTERNKYFLFDALELFLRNDYSIHRHILLFLIWSNVYFYFHNKSNESSQIYFVLFIVPEWEFFSPSMAAQINFKLIRIEIGKCFIFHSYFDMESNINT